MTSDDDAPEGVGERVHNRPSVRVRRIGEKAARDDLSFKLLKRGASGAFMVQIAGAGLTLIAQLVIARLLGAEDYGAYALAITWVTVLVVVALMGQDTSVVRFLPRYVQCSKWDRVRGLRRGAVLIVLVGSGIVAGGAAAIVFFIASTIDRLLEESLLVGFIILPLLAQLQLSGALHRALKHAVYSKVFTSVLRPIILVAIVVGVWATFDNKMTSPVAVGANAVATLIALAVSSWFLGRMWLPEARKARPSYELHAWGRVGAQLFLVAAIGIVLNRLDVLVLGAMEGNKAVGPYYIAVQIAMLATYGVNAINVILAPMIAEYYGAGRYEELARLIHKTAWLIFVVTVSLALTLAAGGYWVLRLFGHGFTAAYVPLLILLVGQCFSAAAGPVIYVMSMTRFERQVPLIFGGGALLNLLLSVLLIPRLGLTGAAIAAALATIAWNLAALIFVRRRLKINPTILPLSTS